MVLRCLVLLAGDVYVHVRTAPESMYRGRSFMVLVLPVSTAVWCTLLEAVSIINQSRSVPWVITLLFVGDEKLLD